MKLLSILRSTPDRGGYSDMDDPMELVLPQGTNESEVELVDGSSPDYTSSSMKILDFDRGVEIPWESDSRLELRPVHNPHRRNKSFGSKNAPSHVTAATTSSSTEVDTDNTLYIPSVRLVTPESRRSSKSLQLQMEIERSASPTSGICPSDVTYDHVQKPHKFCWYDDGQRCVEEDDVVSSPLTPAFPQNDHRMNHVHNDDVNMVRSDSKSPIPTKNIDHEMVVMDDHDFHEVIMRRHSSQNFFEHDDALWAHENMDYMPLTSSGETIHVELERDEVQCNDICTGGSEEEEEDIDQSLQPDILTVASDLTDPTFSDTGVYESKLKNTTTTKTASDSMLTLVLNRLMNCFDTEFRSVAETKKL